MHPFLAIVAATTLLQPTDRPAGETSPPLVARGTGVEISVADVRAAIDALPPSDRARLTSLEARREFLDRVVLLELMAGEARKAGLGDGPDFREGGKKRMVQRLVQIRFNDPKGPATVPDPEVRAYYEANVDRYVHPVKMRLSHITLEAPEGSSVREARLAEARKLRERIAGETRQDPEAFSAAIAAIARAKDPETVAGDLGLLSQQQIARTFTPEVAAAAWALAPGDPSEVLSSPRGFHILQGSGGQPAMNVTLDQARGEIRIILYQARMADAYRRWIDELRAAARVQIDDAALARIRVEPDAPPAAPAAAR